MKNRLQVSLHIKILGLVGTLLLLVISLITVMVGYMESREDVANAENLALQTAKTISYMPGVQDAFRSGATLEELKQLTEQIREEAGASFITIVDRSGGVIGTAKDETVAIEETVTASEKELYQAMVFGSSYVFETGSEGGEVLKGVAPVTIDYGDYKKVEGVVTVDFPMKVIHNEILSDISKIILAAGLVFLLGIAGSFLLAKSIRKDTLGLEPFEISALYREREAVLQSVKEGIVAIDHQGVITTMNVAAKDLLDIRREEVIEKNIIDVLPSRELINRIQSPNKTINKELEYKDKIIIVNTRPLIENGRKTGTVASFRDKTEIKKMVDALSEVRQYSEDLRAQAHEFTGKLYAILGFIQLGKRQEAIELIQKEANLQKQVSEMFFSQIHDEKVQAILLGKFAKASEKKISFKVEEGSSLAPLPDHIPLSPLIVILGNLINNAFDAVKDCDSPEVSFFVTDLGNDIIFEIADNGNGLDKGAEYQIFHRGYSRKGNNRGYGLANVKEEVYSQNGAIEVNSSPGKGTVFTVIIPKQIQENNKRAGG
ncbi:sensor histidine kinase [Sediminibacillus halophilus]|uniref:histidine kinase n=1 Tax=Sediminibacillus halophilus TaxID=482461 RepID=A0A1G9S2E7_9BACI|nr:sensor histidine kinase [Sediminibacillus halophilus]SDM28905.1 two-component system, CitB family, sensor histidine kinase CitS [Sediminibacillus halophilus]